MKIHRPSVNILHLYRTWGAWGAFGPQRRLRERWGRLQAGPSKRQQTGRDEQYAVS